jgi:RNA polymerase sigma factor for flagellar operon FliA
MYYHDDMRLKEIGEVVSLSESRVSRILARAELRLQEILHRRK